MNKKVMGKKFSRDTTSRRAMYRALVRSFVLNQNLTTTYSKARVVIPILEKLILNAKRNALSDRRFVFSFMGNDRLVTDKFFEISKKAVSEKGGYFKYTNLPARKGDNAPMAKVELVKKIFEKEIGKEKGNIKKDSQKEQDITEVAEKKSSVSSVIKKLSQRKKTKK